MGLKYSLLFCPGSAGFTFVKNFNTLNLPTIVMSSVQQDFLSQQGALTFT